MRGQIDFSKRSDGRPVVVAGPCSAETEAQVLGIAEQLPSDITSIFRAGLWKPRTRPGAFEGVGAKGFGWLNAVQQEYGLPVATEVANADHVEQCLKHGIDALWIGARSTVNPFTVQEIADAVRGTGIAVMVKNPVNPDIDLWIGALERIIEAGSSNVAAVHRGFSTHEKGKFRNQPMWNIPIELKRRMPDLPIICDPSHICGNRPLLTDVSQKAIDLNMDGLMLETHLDPANAWSDADQQVTPNELREILNALIWRNPNSVDGEVKAKLEELRTVIDGLDHDILDRLVERLCITRQIGEYKKEHNITILQYRRWNEILDNRKAYLEGKQLSPRFLKKFLEAIHEESIHQQTLVMNTGELEKE